MSIRIINSDDVSEESDRRRPGHEPQAGAPLFRADDAGNDDRARSVQHDRQTVESDRYQRAHEERALFSSQSRKRSLREGQQQAQGLKPRLDNASMTDTTISATKTNDTAQCQYYRAVREP